MTRFMNNCHQVRSQSKDWKAKSFKALGAIKSDGLNGIAKIVLPDLIGSKNSTEIKRKLLLLLNGIIRIKDDFISLSMCMLDFHSDSEKLPFLVLHVAFMVTLYSVLQSIRQITFSYTI